jgi:hypothetical protein
VSDLFLESASFIIKGTHPPTWWWPDAEKVDELKVEFCPIKRSRTNEEKSIQ